MTHEPNSRRVSRNQSALSILLTHCGASTSPPQPNQHEHQHQHAPPSCPACLPASLPTFPAPSQPARQPSFLGLNKSRKCQTAGALTLHERANAPRRCLHTSIVSDGGLSVLLSIHPQALHGITDDSNIARDDGPSRGDIHHSARSNTRTHRLRPPPPAHSKTYTIRCCHLSIGVRTWFIIISLLHVAMASKLRSLWHFRASKGARKCGFGFSQLIIRRAERRAAASELLFPPVDSPLSFSILALLTPWELRIFVAEL
jgi:hypothetical protein